MNWEQTLKLKDKLEKERKDLTMIFQCEDKEFCARFLDLPIGTFYYLPISKWFQVSASVNWFKDAAIANTKEKFCTLGEVWNDYKLNNPVQFNDLREKVIGILN